MKILVNYKREYYPFTTASYIDMEIEKSWKHKLLKPENVGKKRPDFVLNVEPVDKIIKIEGVPSLYWEIDNHVIMGNDMHFYDDVDMVLLAQYQFKEHYKGYKVADLPLGSNPRLHKRYKDEPEKYDIGLLGNDTYAERRQLLEVLKQNFNVLTGTEKPGEPYSRKLNQCKIIFNKAMSGDVNMRFFEGISCGKLLLTDYLPEQEKYAEEGKHYIAYKDAQDMVQKTRFYLENKKEREGIANAGMKHIQKNHSYKKRLEQLIQIVKKEF